MRDRTYRLILTYLCGTIAFYAAIYLANLFHDAREEASRRAASIPASAQEKPVR